ncbi:MAG: DUF4412 domain-containing protein [Cytophagales bacterium]|nr:DUF4412 domain-containing protein [Cytophagales bacterium]
MKTFKSGIILSIGFTFFATAGFSQIFSPDRIKDRIKERAAQKTQNEVDNRVDRGVDKVLDGLFGTVDKGAKTATEAVKDAASSDGTSKESKATEAKTEEDVMKLFGGLMGGMGQAEAPDASYKFASSYVMKITSSEKSKDQTDFTIKYHFAKDGEYFGSKIMQSSDPKMNSAVNSQFMVYDLSKNAMYTFMEMNGQKNMMSIAMKNVEDMASEKVDEKIENTSYTKTGQTKTIAGYPCDGYLMKQDGEEYLVWISKSNVPVVASYYKNLNKAMSGNNPGSIKFNYGANPEMMKMVEQGRAFMGMTHTEKNGEKMEMEVVEINASDNYSFNTAGYSNMMDFNKIMQDAQKQSTEE